MNAKLDALATQPQQHQKTTPGNLVINTSGGQVVSGNVVIGTTWTFSTSTIYIGYTTVGTTWSLAKTYKSFKGEVFGDVRFTE